MILEGVRSGVGARSIDRGRPRKSLHALSTIDLVVKPIVVINWRGCPLASHTISDSSPSG